jgi:hypothetical protein
LDVLQEVPANQIAGNYEEYIDAHETTRERVWKCMIDENGYDCERAQAFDVAPNYSISGRYGKFVQAAVSVIMTIAM